MALIKLENVLTHKKVIDSLYDAGAFHHGDIIIDFVNKFGIDRVQGIINNFMDKDIKNVRK